MRTGGYGVLIVAAMLATAAARPVDLSAPQNHLGSASLEGYVQIWREVDNVDAGQGVSLPLRFSFSSGRDYTSPYLGKGWWLPLLETNAIQIREMMMKVNLLCGKTLYLRRDSVEKTKFQSLNGEWKGETKGDDFTVSRDDGWELLFTNGQLRQLTTDTHRVFEWIYTNGIVTSIKEQGASQPVIAVSNDAQGHPATIIANGQTYHLSFDKRPQVVVTAGQMTVQGFDQSLHEWVWPDGKKEIFDFAVQDNRPSLTITDRNAHEDSYTWDPSSKLIVSENKWTYKIGRAGQQFTLPAVSRTDSSGNTEGVFVDTKTGQTTVSQNGKQTIYSEIQTPGPLYGKLRKVEEVTDGVATVVYRAAYDDAGKLIRKTDAKGFITAFSYSDQGDLKSKETMLPKDSKNLQKLTEKGKQLADLLANAANEEDRQDALRNLAQYYLFDMLDRAKAVGLISQLDHSHAFAVRVQSIGFDESLDSKQKIAGYQVMLADYPEYKERLDFLINATKGK